jgi:hypothetical protein
MFMRYVPVCVGVLVYQSISIREALKFINDIGIPKVPAVTLIV